MFKHTENNREIFEELKKLCLEDLENEDATYTKIIELKNQLEKSKKIEDKEVLVEVYNWLDFKQSGYDLFEELTKNQTTDDSEFIKKKSRMNYQAKCMGDKFAINTPSDRYKIKYRRIFIGAKESELPKFKYHNNPLKTGTFDVMLSPSKCKCCKEYTWVIYSFPFYAEIELIMELECLCPDCIANGEAAKKFRGSFQPVDVQRQFEENFQNEKTVDRVNDIDKINELLYKTPSFQAWQREIWRTHCNDYCEFIGYVSADDLYKMGIMDEVLDDPLWKDSSWCDFPVKDVICNLVSEWDGEERALVRIGVTDKAQGYLFKCLECGKYLVWFDFC